MAAINDYSNEFPRRTLKLLRSFMDHDINYDLDVTFLMNCILGLIVTAVEDSVRRDLIQGNVDNEMLNSFPENVELKIGNQILQEYPKEVLRARGKLSILKKIRNSIAHQNVEPINENDIWVGVSLWNIHPRYGMDFRIKLTTAQLYSLANYITQQYLQVNN